MKIIPRLMSEINLDWPYFVLQCGHFASSGDNTLNAICTEGSHHES
jgi:hypothetical protein